MVLADDMKSPAIEKLELVRKWSINTYKVSDSCHAGYEGISVQEKMSQASMCQKRLGLRHLDYFCETEM